MTSTTGCCRMAAHGIEEARSYDVVTLCGKRGRRARRGVPAAYYRTPSGRTQFYAVAVPSDGSTGNVTCRRCLALLWSRQRARRPREADMPVPA